MCLPTDALGAWALIRYLLGGILRQLFNRIELLAKEVFPELNVFLFSYGAILIADSSANSRCLVARL